MSTINHLQNLENILNLYELNKKLKKLQKWQKYTKVKNKSEVKNNRNVKKRRSMEEFFKITFLKIKELDADQFFIHTIMTRFSFDILLSLIEEKLKKNSIRVPIQPENRLALTLLFLSQGDSFQSLAQSWKLGEETVRCIIYETCEAICDSLKSFYMPEPTLPELDKICEDFWMMRNLPNCIGAIDGKHIAIEKPSTESEFNDSIVLLAACDANYSFTYIDVGTYGSKSDGGIFHVSSFGKRILENKLSLPQPKRLPNSQKVLPCYFVADAAFPLHVNIMKPFPGNYISEEKEYYNKRISEVRRVIENSFGILTARWRILLKTLCMVPENAEKIVLACIVLHNFLLSSKKRKDVYAPPQFVDRINNENNIQNGFCRSQVQKGLLSILPSKNQNTYKRQQSTHIRNQLCSFVNEEGKIK